MNKSVVIFGGGGHGRIIMDTLTSAGRTVTAIVDPKKPEYKLPEHIRYFSDENHFLKTENLADVDIAIGVGPHPYLNTRQHIWEKLKNYNMTPCQVIHPECYISVNSVIGPGTQVLAKAVIQTGAQLNENVVVNTHSIIEHDVIVGAHTHLAPGTILLGGVQIGETSYIGAGAIVRENLRIGDGVIIGMGSIILADVPSKSKVSGLWKG